jgi:biotin carboxyl carrier protein
MRTSTEEVKPELPEGAAAASWRTLAEARSAEEFCPAWLAVLRDMIRELRAGVLLFRDAGDSYSPMAVFPDGTDPSYLGDIARDALVRRQGVRSAGTSGRTQIAYPLAEGNRVHGVVVLDLDTADETTVTLAMRLTHWGVGWLTGLLNRREMSQQQARLAETGFLFDVVLAALGEPDFRKAALAVVNKLAQHCRCHQVQLGLEKGRSVRVVAVSHSAWFDERASLVNLAANAMNEAFDQRVRILWPEPESAAALITAGHRRYADGSGSAAICSLPLEVNQRVVGVLMLERDAPFAARELEFLDTAALTLAPVLNLKHGSDESLLGHARRSGHEWLTRITDSSHPGIKLGVVVVAMVLLAMAIWPSRYRVTSKAVVEGAVQRAAVAPFEGYIRAAPARAGDVVRAGQVLASLEDQDLRLERVRWDSELEVALRKEREAMATNDRVNARLAAAQANQARAQLDLVIERLARVDISAPFDAVVVKGDLSQQLGSPVEQGKVLFELAPLDAWRVILKVDERDIAWVREGQHGELMLSSLPGQSSPFVVSKVTPVSVAEEGRNYFRVEADLGKGAPKLRPNMEGVGKIEAGEKSLLWIWTHRLVDWVRMIWWEYLP